MPRTPHQSAPRRRRRASREAARNAARRRIVKITQATAVAATLTTGATAALAATTPSGTVAANAVVATALGSCRRHRRCRRSRPHRARRRPRPRRPSRRQEAREMAASTEQPTSYRFQALGTTALVAVAEPDPAAFGERAAARRARMHRSCVQPLPRLLGAVLGEHGERAARSASAPSCSRRWPRRCGRREPPEARSTRRSATR